MEITRFGGYRLSPADAGSDTFHDRILGLTPQALC